MDLKKVNFITLCITTPLYLFLCVTSGVITPLSVMAFDAPGSEKLLFPYVFVITMLACTNVHFQLLTIT
jgi:hypothetical protein